MATAFRLLLILLICTSASVVSAQAQNAASVQSNQNDPLQRPRKPQKTNQAENSYKTWRDNDVKDIITDDELRAFNKLTNEAERASFVEAFWRRRDPTPDTAENEFKEEHYGRRAYADDHFSAGIPGSKTDRGRIYIIHGPPDSIDAHPSGGPYQRPADEGGGFTTTFPFEIWRYRNISHIGQEIEIEFVDPCVCGEYHIAFDRAEKDALRNVPNAGLTDREALGLDSKANRSRGGLETLGASFFGNNQSKQFDRLNTLTAMTAPPPVKYKELKEVVDVKLRYNLLPFDVRVDFVRSSADTVIVPITLQVANHELTYAGKDGVQHASVNIYGRVTTLAGNIVHTFEDPLRLDVPTELLPKFVNNVSLYQQMLPLHPGRYRLDLVLKDVNGGKLGTLYQSIIVPDFSDNKFSTSTLVLADQMEPVPARDTGSGIFVLGPTRVRPRVPSANGDVVFKQGEKVNLWMQVYNLARDEKTGKAQASAEYKVINAATNQSVYEQQVVDLPTDAASGSTLKQLLSQGTLGPGLYQVMVTVRDQVAQQELVSQAKFVVK